MAVTLRSVKGSALSHSEMDANFQEVIDQEDRITENMKELTHNFTTDTNYVLTDAENKYQRIKVTDTTVVLTTTRNIVVDTLERFFVAENATAQSITFITAAGTGITVSAGDTQILQCDGTNVINSDFKNYVEEYALSGGWSPTITIVSNVSSVIGFLSYYMCIGGYVHCTGKVYVNPVSSGAETSVGISLPISSNLTASSDCSGNFTSLGSFGYIEADSTNDIALLTYTSTGVDPETLYFNFMYKVK